MNAELGGTSNNITSCKRSVEDIMNDAKKLKTQTRYDKAWAEFMEFHEQPELNKSTQSNGSKKYTFLILEFKCRCSFSLPHKMKIINL